jgi:hypothetical protein
LTWTGAVLLHVSLRGYAGNLHAGCHSRCCAGTLLMLL